MKLASLHREIAAADAHSLYWIPGEVNRGSRRSLHGTSHGQQNRDGGGPSAWPGQWGQRVETPPLENATIDPILPRRGEGFPHEWRLHHPPRPQVLSERRILLTIWGSASEQGKDNPLNVRQ
jgi:hypothetical protein